MIVKIFWKTSFYKKKLLTEPGDAERLWTMK